MIKNDDIWWIFTKMNKNRTEILNKKSFIAEMNKNHWLSDVDTDQQVDEFADEHIIVAVSGGIDSMVLLDLLQYSGFKIIVAHFNFQLRGEASDLDQRLVEKTCAQYGVTIEVKTEDTQLTFENSKGSLQLIARELRYNWFEDLVKKYQAKFVCLAHHLDDQIETMILNLTRGSGIEGFGMKAQRNHYIRPLLNFTKSQIKDYALSKGIEWREDASNEKVDYKRNYIRHNILPHIQEIAPEYERIFRRNFKRLKETEDLINDQVLVVLKKLKENQKHDIIEIPYLLEDIGLYGFHWSAFLLCQVLKSYGFHYIQCEEIFEQYQTKKSGKNFYSKTHHLSTSREAWFLQELKAGDENHSIITFSKSDVLEKSYFQGPTISLTWEIMKIQDWNKKFDPKNLTVSLDFDQIQFPLKLRKWRNGDKFIPLGMKGQKKVSDFLIDQKIPTIFKENQFVLEGTDHIYWLVGRRIDTRLKITKKTKRIIKLTLNT